MKHSCIFHILMIVWFEQSWPCNLHNHHRAICTIIIVQFAQSQLCNTFFCNHHLIHLQNFTSIYNYLLLGYHDYIDDCTIMIFQIDANLCLCKKMSRWLNVNDCIIFYLMNICIYSMHIWPYNHLKIMIAQSFMQYSFQSVTQSSLCIQLCIINIIIKYLHRVIF